MYSVLIIDDESLSRQTIKKLITQNIPKCSTIYEADNAANSVEIIEKLSPDLFDMISQMMTAGIIISTGAHAKGKVWEQRLHRVKKQTFAIDGKKLLEKRKRNYFNIRATRFSPAMLQVSARIQKILRKRLAYI